MNALSPALQPLFVFDMDHNQFHHLAHLYTQRVDSFRFHFVKMRRRSQEFVARVPVATLAQLLPCHFRDTTNLLEQNFCAFWEAKILQILNLNSNTYFNCGEFKFKKCKRFSQLLKLYISSLSPKGFKTKKFFLEDTLQIPFSHKIKLPSQIWDHVFKFSHSSLKGVNSKSPHAHR